MSSLAPGSTLCDDRYRLDEVVGRGGMAMVWRATDLQLERAVAIKVISDVLASDPSFVARFEREARLAAGLNHPNLVKVFDFSVEEAGRPVLVMEYVAGGTLVEARGRALDAPQLARELLDAVAHIHGAGILHRDIKPANVLLAPDGSARLTDFGIARGEDQTGLTMTGQVLGTLRYIAPEVAAGEPATVRSDLYSLGVLLGEVAGDEPDPALAELVARMTARDPAERPGSAAEALAELEPTRPLARGGGGDLDVTRALPAGGSPSRPRGSAPSRPSGSLPARRTGSAPSRIQLAGAAAVLLALIAIVIAAGTGGGEREPAAQPARPAAAGAPVDRQIDRLVEIVRSAAR